jgi:hypothetical protein
MGQQLIKEVKSSKILNGYHTIVKWSKIFIEPFKVIASFLFFWALFETFLLGDPTKLCLGLNVAIWIPGFLFAIVFLIFHFLTGIKLRKMSIKYNRSQTDIQKDVDSILNT